ncbi:MAG: hypothetical protein ACRDZP_08020 [Acidimicrobiales bacterium]
MINRREYAGAAWRARFVRSPKAALELAHRQDFAALGQLALVRLGLKTGADDFFFVSPAGPRALPCAAPEMATITIEGLAEWQGEIPKADLVAAIRNPHELFEAGERVFAIPRRPIAYYLYPRDQNPRPRLDEYVRHAEQIGTAQQKLVRDNATDRWYRQARGLPRSRWALPYNSAYDYGAWDNAEGAVLNGRFVGVDPREEVDADLLGAALNSTFAAAGRLLEGVATGTEGAIDVGPPAARRIMLPDVRRFSAPAIAAVKHVLDEIRRTDRMPPAPIPGREIDPLRRRLDVAMLGGLGMSPGAAQGLLEGVYASYCRWRVAVARVEAQMRIYRAEMNRSGVSRARRRSPEENAAAEIWEIVQADYPRLPFDLLQEGEDVETLDLRRMAAIPPSKPLFDETKVIMTGGREVDLGDWERVRYVGMLHDIGFRAPFSVPTDGPRCGALVDQFELVRANLRTAAAQQSAERVARDRRGRAVGLVEAYWTADCRRAGMLPPAPVEPESPETA